MVAVCDYVKQALVIVRLLTPSDEDGCCCVGISKDLVILTLIFFPREEDGRCMCFIVTRP